MSTPSLLEYARFHGLAVDYGEEDPFAYLNALEPDCDLAEVDAALPDPIFPSCKPSVLEPKLQLSREASQILSGSIQDPCPDISSHYLLPRFHRLKNLKLEEPLLSTDHGTDVWNFKRSPATSIELQNLLGKAETSEFAGDNKSADEWHDLVARSHRRFSNQVRHERPHVSRESLSRISKNCRGEWNEIDTYGVLMVGPVVKRDTRQTDFYPLTRSSVSPSPSPPSPSKHNSRLEAKDELDMADPHIEANEHSDTDNASIETAEDHAISHNGEVPGEEVLKMEEPADNSLTPQKLETHLPTGVSQHSVNNVPTLRSQFEISSPAKSVHLKLWPQAESLKASVPVLQPARIQSVAMCTMLDGILKELFDKSLTDPLLSPTLEEKNFTNWRPFSNATSQNTLKESINDPRRLSEILNPSRNVMLSKQMLWKRPGLLLLDSEDFIDVQMDVDNDLNQTISEEHLCRIPQKRCTPASKLYSHSPRKKVLLGSEPAPILSPRRAFQPNRGRLKELIASQLRIPAPNVSIAAQKEADPHGSRPFSAAKSLSTFLDLRGSKFKRASFFDGSSRQQLSDDPIQNTPSECSDNIETCPQTESEAVSRPQDQINLIPAAPANKTNMFLYNDMLTFEKFDPPKSIIVNTRMLRIDRCLMASLERHAEDSLSIIYRDMELPDMILNPHTCLIFTNLQALNQRSLPGQYGSAREGLVQSAVSQLVRDYEMTFIFVVVPDTGGSVSRNLQDVMTNFTGFCVSKGDKDTKICPIWVSANADTYTVSDDLQSKVWTLLHQYAFAVPQPSQLRTVIPNELSLIHEETIGEQFLRKAGLNPMAAQVALHVLKRQNPTLARVSQSGGLNELAQLTTEGRMDLFREVLGSKTVQKLNSAFKTQAHNLRWEQQ